MNQCPGIFCVLPLFGIRYLYSSLPHVRRCDVMRTLTIKGFALASEAPKYTIPSNLVVRCLLKTRTLIEKQKKEKL